MTRYYLGLILLAVAGVCAADTRETVVRDYVAALAGHQYAEAARYIRASDLSDYKENFSILFRAEAEAGKSDFRHAVFGESGAALRRPPLWFRFGLSRKISGNLRLRFSCCNVSSISSA